MQSRFFKKALVGGIAGSLLVSHGAAYGLGRQFSKKNPEPSMLDFTVLLLSVTLFSEPQLAIVGSHILAFCAGRFPPIIRFTKRNDNITMSDSPLNNEQETTNKM